MEFVEISINLKIPKLGFKQVRYRVRTLLFLMIVVAIGALLWRRHHQAHYQQLWNKLEVAKEARDAALNDWRQTVAVGRNANHGAEKTARREYFLRRASVDEAVRRIQSHPRFAAASR